MHDLARLQQDFDGETAGLRVRRLRRRLEARLERKVGGPLPADFWPGLWLTTFGVPVLALSIALIGVAVS